MIKEINRNNYKSKIILHKNKIINAILHSQGIQSQEDVQKFLYPNLNMLHSPFLMKDMNVAVDLISNTIASNQRIVIYHDYDCDGVCASTILYQALKSINANVDCVCPEREEGYGLNIDRVNYLSKTYKLIITVDLGISNYDEVLLAKSLGMSVIISDHHQLPDVLPPADAIIHTILDPYPFKYLCGAGVAYKIAYALIGESANDYIDIVAIATVGDIVSLTGENRILVKYGIEKIKQTTNFGIKALLETSGIKNVGTLNSRDIAFKLVPRINVAGRIETANIARELLNSDSYDKAIRLAKRLDELNCTRKEIEKEILDYADLCIKKYDFNKNKFIVISGENWNAGVIGLIAGKLTEKLNLPSAVFSINGDKATASIRSIKGLNIYRVLKYCSNLFIKWGGHEQAAGLTLYTKNLAAFEAMANKYIKDNVDSDVFVPTIEYDQELTIDDVNISNCDAVEICEPFGQGNLEPVFLLKNINTNYAKKVGTDFSHLKLSFSGQNGNVDAIAFGLAYKINLLSSNVDIIAKLQKNIFNGNIKAQLTVQNIELDDEHILNYIELINDYSLLAYDVKWLCDSLTVGKYSNYLVYTKELEFDDIYSTLVLSNNKTNIIKFYKKWNCSFDIAINTPKSKTTLNTILLMPDFEQIMDRKYKKIILLDNNINPYQLGFLHHLWSEAEIVSTNNIDLTQQIYIGIEKYRTIYVNLLKNCYNNIYDLAAQINEKPYNVLFALFVLKDMKLIDFDYQNYNINVCDNPKKCSIEDSKLIQTLISKGGNYA